MTHSIHTLSADGRLAAPAADDTARAARERQSRLGTTPPQTPANRALIDALFRNTPLFRSFTLNREGI